MPKLLSRIVALLLVPCLAGDALIPAGAATFAKQEAALIAGPGAKGGLPSFQEQALSGRALGALRSIFKGPARLTFESELTATSPIIPPPRQWADFLPSPSQLVWLAFILTAHHFGH